MFAHVSGCTLAQAAAGSPTNDCNRHCETASAQRVFIPRAQAAQNANSQIGLKAA